MRHGIGVGHAATADRQQRQHAGVDAHGPDWAQSPEGEAAIGRWLQPDGFVPAVCDDHPCYMAGWSDP